MSKRGKILEDMRLNTEWNKLDDSSKSSLYQAFGIWKEQAGEEYSKIKKTHKTYPKIHNSSKFTFYPIIKKLVNQN